MDNPITIEGRCVMHAGQWIGRIDPGPRPGVVSLRLWAAARRLGARGRAILAPDAEIAVRRLCEAIEAHQRGQAWAVGLRAVTGRTLHANDVAARWPQGEAARAHWRWLDGVLKQAYRAPVTITNY